MKAGGSISIAFLDAEALATFQVGGVNVTALLSGRNPPSDGAVTELAVHGEDAHVFDAATGLSLVCN